MAPHPAEAPDGTPAVPVGIPARSERQAMDWSLVLTSQGIGVTLQRSSPDGSWQLGVDPADHHRALHLIRTWRVENRRWAWRNQIPESRLDFHWGALLWVFAISVLHAGGAVFQAAGRFATGRVREGEWWRTFTAVWLHADLGHLASNATLGGVVLGLAMGHFGAGTALLAGLLAGAAGNLLGLALRGHDYVGLGASGLVMGAIGLLTAQAFALYRLSWRATRYVLPAVLGGGFLFLVLGTDGRGDVIAHLGGFLGGLGLGAMAALVPPGWRPRTSRVAWVTFLLLTGLTWGLALRR